jgi:molecular chaperone GrpE
VEYIYNQFKQILENNGVMQFGQEGDEFNEAYYITVDTVETDDEKKDGKVAQLIQKGYKIGDKVLREARVKTFKKK